MQLSDASRLWLFPSFVSEQRCIVQLFWPLFFFLKTVGQNADRTRQLLLLVWIALRAPGFCPWLRKALSRVSSSWIVDEPSRSVEYRDCLQRMVIRADRPRWAWFPLICPGAKLLRLLPDYHIFVMFLGESCGFVIVLASLHLSTLPAIPTQLVWSLSSRFWVWRWKSVLPWGSNRRRWRKGFHRFFACAASIDWRHIDFDCFSLTLFAASTLFRPLTGS